MSGISEPKSAKSERDSFERDLPESGPLESGPPERTHPDIASSEPAEQAAVSAGHGRRQRPELSPNQRALGLLVRREHSRKELTRKLAARGVEAEQAQAAVDRMTAEGWQNDARFAEQLVRSRAGGGYGPLRIRAELGTHGLDREAIQAAMDAFEGDWAENARDLVRRRFGAALGDRAQQRKAAEFLIRRGFGGDHVRAATRFDPDED
jgi:regulatory protein